MMMSLYTHAVSSGTDDIRDVCTSLTRSTSFVEQLYVELSYKSINKKVFDVIIDTISSLSATKSCLAAITATYHNGSITISNTSTKDVIETIRPVLGARIINILTRYPPGDTAQMILRYESMARGGQHWSIPQRQYKHLYKTWGVRWEAFASPLNSGLIDLPGTSYCSLFSHDKMFGSVGNFFSYPLYGRGHNTAADIYLDSKLNQPSSPPPDSEANDLSKSIANLKIGDDTLPPPIPMRWAINPPFITTVIDKVVSKIETELSFAEKYGIEVMLFVILPTWNDLSSYNALMDSPYKRFHLNLQQGHHYYDHASTTKIVNSKSTVFVLDTCSVRKNYTRIAHHMGC